MFRNRLKTILLAFTIILTLTIIASAQVFSIFEKDLENRLLTKKFLAPTEFYSQPITFRKGQIYDDKWLLSLFGKKGYRARDLNQRLLPGDFWFIDNKNIKIETNSSISVEKTKIECPFTENIQKCFGFINKNIPIDNSESQIQWIFLSESNSVVKLAKGYPASEVLLVQLEAELLAQYLNSEPIMQEEYSLSEIPTNCPNAIMAIEDAQFLEHKGFSVTGTIRGLVVPILKGKKPQGGSTITQQLVKNYFLSNERSVKRKAQELILSVLIEKKLTKDQILETYMNIIYMGQNGPFQLIGFGAASNFYFQKKLPELNLSECALLAAVLNGPGVYNPFTKPEKALTRRNVVLGKMKDLKLISEREFEEAKQIPLPSKKPLLASETAPYFIDAARKQVKKLGFELEGLKIYTSLNLEWQQLAQQSLKNHLEKLEKENKKILEQTTKGNRIEGVVLSADPMTGLISVAVGGRSYKMTQFNRAIEGHRQVGSIFKPIVYLTALGKKNPQGENYNPLSLIKDEKIEIKYDKQKWSPENYSKTFFGDVPMYFALKNSLNAATAKLGMEVGLEDIIKNAKLLGVTSELKKFPALTLGSFEMYPLEVLQVYTTFSNLGKRVELSFVEKIFDGKGNKIFEHNPKPESVIDGALVSELLSILKQGPVSGTSKMISNSKYDFPVAGKTGTTSDYKDTWFAGFTPFMTSIVWVGYDNNQFTGLSGATGAVPIWLNYMKEASLYFGKEDFNFPNDSIIKKRLSNENLTSLGISTLLEPDLAPFELIFSKDSITDKIKELPE